MRSATILLLFWGAALGAQDAQLTASAREASVIDEAPRQLFSGPVIPFELVKGIMFIRAEVDGREGWFAIDTGAPEVLLNSRQPTSSGVESFGICGRVRARWTTLKTLRVGPVKRKHVPALALDLTHLEEITGRPIEGMLGYAFLKNYELFVDYAQGYLQLLSPKRRHRNTLPRPQTELPFVLNGHLPVVKARVGKRTLFFGLDTGAGANLLSSRKLKKIREHVVLPGPKAKLVGLSPEVRPSSLVTVAGTLIRDNHFPRLQFVVADISHMQSLESFNVDGLLGYPFLQATKFSINYRMRKLFIWESEDPGLMVSIEGRKEKVQP
ncbi:MAG: hypothetical protein D6765_16625 [Bacteroidetes bacterium]|nr:MAG: hypothetical protein D6765_16625 [Bacteroidota bacterium]